jgi:4-amino-4-deoxy-L-arabinose transferase-like glycosyltransferase
MGGRTTMTAKGGGLRTALKTAPVHAIALGGLALVTIGVLILLLLNHPFPLGSQPFPDAHEYVNAAYRLAHGHGYTTTVRDNPYSPHAKQPVNPPRYPPGTSLVLAPFALFGSSPASVEFGSRLIVVVLVVTTGWAGYTVGGWYPALISALIIALSPFARINSHIVMSDALGAFLMVVCVPLISLRATWATYLVGFLAGFGVVVRDSGLIVVLCLLIVVHGRGRLRVALGAVGPIVGLALYNRSTFGAPWSSGYSYWLGPFREYALSYATKRPWPLSDYYQSSLTLFHLAEQNHYGLVGPLPNVAFYPLILLGFSAVYGPPWLTLIGLVTALRFWERPEARFTVLVACGSVVVYVANFSQDPRFLAGPCILLTVWGLLGLVKLTRAVWSRYGEPRWNPDPSALMREV